jgi:hypothetical protein
VPPQSYWCADNSAFGASYPGDERWFAWLSNHTADRTRCLFAVAPDVVGDASATWERSAPWLERIRTLGYPAALAAQNGLERLEVPWSKFDALFIGGDTAWKLGGAAQRLIVEARYRGKHVHMGRVNSWRRILYASLAGCDSADGTYLAFGPDRNLPTALGWLSRLELLPEPMFTSEEMIAMTAEPAAAIPHLVTSWSDNAGVHHRRCTCTARYSSSERAEVERLIQPCRDAQQLRLAAIERGEV